MSTRFVYSYLDESVAETLADALNWDLGVAVVVAVVVADSHLGGNVTE